jgi:DNA-binding NarL/FixJ family response regulator
MKITLLERDESISNVILDYLNENYECILSHSGNKEGAYILLKSYPPDILIMDEYFINFISMINPYKIKTIIMSTNSRFKCDNRFDRCLIKPFSIDELDIILKDDKNKH